MSIANRIALVTGAYRGIGKAIALKLAEKGVVVIGADIDTDKADGISAYLREAGLRGDGIVMNVTDADSIKTALNTIKDKYGVPTILINNAGITRDNLMLRMKEEEWDSVINTNLNSIFHVTQCCLRDMIKARWGRIVNIASMVALTGNPGQANYSAAKAGLIAMGKSLAKEVAQRGITVNSVAPGFIATDMTKNISAEYQEKYLSNIPMNRAGEPNDVANAVVFLVSDEAAYITGETINVNGGLYMV